MAIFFSSEATFRIEIDVELWHQTLSSVILNCWVRFLETIIELYLQTLCYKDPYVSDLCPYLYSEASFRIEIWHAIQSFRIQSSVPQFNVFFYSEVNFRIEILATIIVFRGTIPHWFLQLVSKQKFKTQSNAGSYSEASFRIEI